MAANFQPLSARENNGLKLPIPPPPLMTRHSNDPYDGPSTPTRSAYGGFTSPQQTPSGSPSKGQLPPGAYDLPNAFDTAMKLVPVDPGSPTKIGRQQLQPTSPTKNLHTAGYAGETPNYDQAATPGSPTRKSNKENTPPNASRPGIKKESSFQSQAAHSRQQQYTKTLEADQRPAYVQRGLSAEDIEKLQKPNVKRLANVTQLCK